jgi:HEAT repeat protein
MTPDWRTWRDDVFGDPYLVWHDGPDFRRLLTLPADEVARMLPSGIAAEDPVAAQAIHALADAGKAPGGAEELLRTAATTATETFLVRVARALHALTGDESWANPIASVLTSNAFWGVRIDAAIALGWFTPTPALIETLGRGVRDEEYLVRCHCANTLLRYASRAKRLSHIRDVTDRPTLFAKIASNNDPGRWREAAAQLTAAALKRIS